MQNVNDTGKGKLAITVVAILAAFLLVGFLVMQMVRIVHPAPAGAERATARAKDNGEIRAGGEEALKSWGYVDQPKGIVRLPIDEAMKLTIQGYQNPGGFHSNLVTRVEKAAAQPPKAANPFE
jgi:hypothetical protein